MIAAPQSAEQSAKRNFFWNKKYIWVYILKNGYTLRPLTKLKSAVKFFVKNLFKLREIWYNVGIENSVIMGCRNAFGRNKPTNKNGVCMYRGFGTERPYFKKDR